MTLYFAARVCRTLPYHRILSGLMLVFAAMLTASMTTLFMVRARAQVSIPERLSVVESRLHVAENENDRVVNEIMALQMAIANDRDRLAEQQSRISTVQGIGIGLGSIVMVLQVFSMLLGYSKRLAEAKDE